MMQWWCHSPKNHERAVKIEVSIAYLQFKFDEVQNDYLTQTLVFLAGVELKKIKFLLEKIELTHLF